MMDAEWMAGEFGRLSSEAIGQIIASLMTGELADVAINVLWDRHAAIGGTWPERDATISWTWSEVGRRDQPPQIVRLVAHCNASSGVADPAHQVVRHLQWSYDGPDGPRELSGYECSCGRRKTVAPGIDRLVLRWHQLRPDVRVWPVVMRPVIGQAYEACYQVCKYARHAQDPNHAPVTGMWCLCGGDLATGHRFLPVQ